MGMTKKYFQAGEDDSIFSYIIDTAMTGPSTLILVQRGLFSWHTYHRRNHGRIQESIRLASLWGTYDFVAIAEKSYRHDTTRSYVMRYTVPSCIEDVVILEKIS